MYSNIFKKQHLGPNPEPVPPPVLPPVPPPVPPPDSSSSSDPDSDSDTEPESNTEPEPDPEPDPIPEPNPEPIPEPDPEPDPIPEPNPEPIPEPDPQPRPEQRDNFTIPQRNKLYKELVNYFEKKEGDKRVRCPCCVRLLGLHNSAAGHIIAASKGGTTDINNGLLICKQCNNNDTRHMYEMVKEEWGEDHIRTKEFEEICKFLGKNYIEN